MKMIQPRNDTYRSRFGLAHHLLPRDASGKSFFDQTKGYLRLQTAFQELLDEPGLGVLTAEPGVGKTAAIRNLCDQLPEPDFKVIYLCDTAASAVDMYRVLALELGLKPSHRRAQLWRDLKRTIAHVVEEQHTLPIFVIDEAQLLSDRFLVDLSGFLNFAFDRKTLLTLWLVGLPALSARLRMQHHAPLASRIAGRVHLEALTRDDFAALLEHGFKAAGTRDKLLTDSAFEILWRATSGVPRAASRLLRASLRAAHRMNQNLVDDHAMTAAIDELTPRQE
ncbi:MAG TPA: AAA family ATPase [Anaeromyxobacteraceae bacterium]|nr:AAA family ATPase [Anaeromyxobacteraceae bacterium]